MFFKLLCGLIAASSFGYSAIPFDVEVTTGSRSDEFVWNVADITGTPNIISELSWKDLCILDIGLNLKSNAKNSPYVRTSLNYGEAISGTGQDSDYLEDNRQNEFSRSKSSASDSYVYDASLAFGYKFDFCNRFSIAPLAGYSLDSLYLKMRDGLQVVNTINHVLGRIWGLNSSYHASFYGPFIGADMTYKMNWGFNILATFEYHFSTYRGSGRWNLREDFYKNFKHIANGYGILGSIGTLYEVNDQLSIGMLFSYQTFKVKKGHGITYVLEEDDSGKYHNAVYRQGLNKVNWNSIRSSVIVKYAF